MTRNRAHTSLSTRDLIELAAEARLTAVSRYDRAPDAREDPWGWMACNPGVRLRWAHLRNTRAYVRPEQGFCISIDPRTIPEDVDRLLTHEIGHVVLDEFYSPWTPRPEIDALEARVDAWVAAGRVAHTSG